MTAQTDVANLTNYVSDVVRQEQKYGAEELFLVVKNVQKFVTGVFVLAGIPDTKSVVSEKGFFFYRIEPNGEEYLILELLLPTFRCMGKYSEVFRNTLKAVFALECLLTGALLWPPDLRRQRLNNAASGLDISTELILAVAKRF